MKKYLLFLICIAMLALVGCARQGQPILPTDSAAQRWQDFAAKTADFSTSEVLSGSLRFGPVNDTRRVTYNLWSEPSETSSAHDAGSTERIIRIEIQAGIGGTVGDLRFADGRMTLLLPKEGRVYLGSSSNENLRKLLGLSLPLGVQDLNDFLAGSLFSALDEPRPERYETQEDGSIVYFCNTAEGMVEITLDGRSLPVRFKEQNGWDLDIACGEDGLPSKLSGRVQSASGEQRLVLLVKERRPASGIQASGTGLDIPSGFTVYSLD